MLFGNLLMMRRTLSVEATILLGGYLPQIPRQDLSARSQSQSYITTDDLSASVSRCQAPIWDPWPIFLPLSLIIFRQLRMFYVDRPLWREVGSVQVQVIVILGPTVSRSLRLGVVPLLERVTRCYVSLVVNYCLSFSCKAPSLTRGRVCNLQCNDVS
jgi:hypothetical protein